MSFAPNHGNQHPYNRSSRTAAGGLNNTGGGGGGNYGGKVRTDFSGLFPPASSGTGAPPPTTRVRTRNNSQTQKPVSLMFGSGSVAVPSRPVRSGSESWPELQFPVDEEVEHQLHRDTISCESRRGGGGASADLGVHGWNNHNQAAAVQPSVTLNNTGFLSATTRPSFDILNDTPAQDAYEFFAAAAAANPAEMDLNPMHHSRDLYFGGGGNDGAGVNNGCSNNRQRHLSLEDYNDMQFSGNESSNDEVSFETSQRQLLQQQSSTKEFGVGGHNMHIGHFNSIMQVDVEQDLSSINGSDRASTPSTPSTAGLGLPNAFTFPVNTIESKIQHTNRSLGSHAAAPLQEIAAGNAANAGESLHDELRHKLLAAIEEKSRKSLQFPCNLLQEIAAHVIQEASLEPCGLKGCLIFIYFEGENDCQFLNTLRCDPATIPPTFELTLTLRQNQAKMRGWIPDIVKRNFSVMPNVMVSTSYRLVKRRKYRLNEIEELSLQ